MTSHIKSAHSSLKKGVEVKYSRNNRTDNLGTTVNSSLAMRSTMANNWNADLFVSIHCNAFGDSAVSGTETLIYSKGSKAEQLATKVNNALVGIGFINRGVKVNKSLAVLKKYEYACNSC